MKIKSYHQFVSFFLFFFSSDIQLFGTFFLPDTDKIIFLFLFLFSPMCQNYPCWDRLTIDYNECALTVSNESFSIHVCSWSSGVGPLDEWEGQKSRMSLTGWVYFFCENKCSQSQKYNESMPRIYTTSQ